MTPRSLLVVALWCCALLMQSIGLLHGYVHPQAGHGVRLVQACPMNAMQSPTDAAACVHRSSQPVTVEATAAAGWLHALFAGHDSRSAGCTLFDQLTHADLLHDAPTLPLAYAAPAHPDAVHAAWHHARQATGFLARAPPAIG